MRKRIQKYDVLVFYCLVPGKPLHYPLTVRQSTCPFPAGNISQECHGLYEQLATLASSTQNAQWQEKGKDLRHDWKTKNNRSHSDVAHIQCLKKKVPDLQLKTHHHNFAVDSSGTLEDGSARMKMTGRKTQTQGGDR